MRILILIIVFILTKSARPKQKRGAEDEVGPSAGAITRFRPGGHYILLTFDDGPHPILTPKLLDVLKSKKARATFFVQGTKALDYPNILKRMLAEGHEVASRGWSHNSITLLEPNALLNELQQTTKVIEDITKKRPVAYRPPYGNTNITLNTLITLSTQQKVILWSLDSLDWENRDAAQITKHLLSRAKPGDVILAHDTSPQMVAATSGLVDGLMKDGYELLTVSEILSFPDDTPK